MILMPSIRYPVTNEKAIGLIELQNTLTFVVESGSTKPQIKKDVEDLFEVKVASVNTLITPTGQKRAYVKLKEGFKADDVAAKLKIV
jgi:large subunit ribosomal protein L23